VAVVVAATAAVAVTTVIVAIVAAAVDTTDINLAIPLKHFNPAKFAGFFILKIAEEMDALQGCSKRYS
jgi:hypothetical protein